MGKFIKQDKEKTNDLFDTKQVIGQIHDEDTSNSGYLHLKHFLDSEDDINKNGPVLSDNRISRGNTPDSSAGARVFILNIRFTYFLKISSGIIISHKP